MLILSFTFHILYPLFCFFFFRKMISNILNFLTCLSEAHHLQENKLKSDMKSETLLNEITFGVLVKILLLK